MATQAGPASVWAGPALDAPTAPTAPLMGGTSRRSVGSTWSFAGPDVRRDPDLMSSRGPVVARDRKRSPRGRGRPVHPLRGSGGGGGRAPGGGAVADDAGGRRGLPGCAVRAPGPGRVRGGYPFPAVGRSRSEDRAWASGPQCRNRHGCQAISQRLGRLEAAEHYTVHERVAHAVAQQA